MTEHGNLSKNININSKKQNVFKDDRGTNPSDKKAQEAMRIARAETIALSEHTELVGEKRQGAWRRKSSDHKIAAKIKNSPYTQGL